MRCAREFWDAGNGGAIRGRTVWKLLFYDREREIMIEHPEVTGGDGAVFVADENGLQGWVENGYSEGDCPHTEDDALASLFRYAVGFAKARVNRMY